MDVNDDLQKACDTLLSGGIILYPTDTVWGIGCDATNPEAVAAVYRLKRRADSKALLLLADSLATVEKHFPELTPAAKKLLLDPARPTTVILPGARGIAPGLMAADSTVGVRITSEDFSRELCRRAGRLIVSTSANISGHPTASRFDEIEREIIDSVDYACMSRRDDCEKKTPSRIVKVNPDNSLTIIRP